MNWDLCKSERLLRIAAKGFLFALLWSSAAHGQAVFPPGMPNGSSPWESGSKTPSSLTVEACGNLPTGVFEFIFDADNPDGLGIRSPSRRDQDLIATWVNTGSDATGDAGAPDDGSGASWRPMLQKGAAKGRDAISFGGSADNRKLADSDVSLKGIHETGDFEIIVVLRHDRTQTNLDGIIGNTEISTDKGFIVVVDGSRHVSAYVVAGAVVGTVTSTWTLPLGTWTTLSIRGDGTSIKVSKNFASLESSAYTSRFVHGNATNGTVIGGTASGGGVVYPIDAAYAMVLISTQELSAGERAATREVIKCRYRT